MTTLHASIAPQLFGDGISRGAQLAGPAGDAPAYRYRLWRHWGDPHGPVLLWVMFNPSTADHLVDDPTIRRCIGFSERWSFAGLEVVNLYAIRSAAPWTVYDVPDPVGPDNDAVIRARLAAASAVVVAWGKLIGPAFWARVDVVRRAARAAGRSLECLGHTMEGFPKHPLYLHADTPRVLYRHQ